MWIAEQIEDKHTHTHKPCSLVEALLSLRAKLTARSDRATEVPDELHTLSPANKQEKNKYWKFGWTCLNQPGGWRSRHATCTYFTSTPPSAQLIWDDRDTSTSETHWLLSLWWRFFHCHFSHIFRNSSHQVLFSLLMQHWWWNETLWLIRRWENVWKYFRQSGFPRLAPVNSDSSRFGLGAPSASSPLASTPLWLMIILLFSGWFFFCSFVISLQEYFQLKIKIKNHLPSSQWDWPNACDKRLGHGNLSYRLEPRRTLIMPGHYHIKVDFIEVAFL